MLTSLLRDILILSTDSISNIKVSAISPISDGNGRKRQENHMLLFLSPDWLIFCHMHDYLS